MHEELPPPLAAGKVVLALTRQEGATKALALTRTMAPAELGSWRWHRPRRVASQPAQRVGATWGSRLEIEPIGRGSGSWRATSEAMETEHTRLR